MTMRNCSRRIATFCRRTASRFSPHRDGQEAIPLVEQNPDILLVILDLAMPRMDGREWLRWFRGCRKESPVIIISAYKLDASDEDLKPAVILEKPFHVAELLDLVGLFCGLGTPMASEAS